MRWNICCFEKGRSPLDLQQFLKELMQESPIYQEIMQKGVQRGKQDTVMRQLIRSVGTISPQLQAQIQNLFIQQLDSLSEALLDFSDASDLTI